MEIESPVIMGKASKRTVEQVGDTEMEDAHINKKARIQGSKEE